MGADTVDLAIAISCGVVATGWIVLVWIANDKGLAHRAPDSEDRLGQGNVAERVRRYRASVAAAASVSLSDMPDGGSLSEPDR